MAGLMSKRQQARNEKALQDLLRSVPGNDRCADCATKNPGWASWSLGIFLCMSCAALHRKMGTHISKVKSLSMDSWSSDQVDNMKKVGNAVSNKKYNPGNTKPDIPVDADEVGGAMERFIRRKYEFREFSGGNGRRATVHNTGNASISSSEDQPPPLPPKPGKKFGFALRSTSATYSRPKMDKYTPPMSPTFSGSDGRESPPRVNKASRVFGSTVGNVQDDGFKAKMASLREMGFNDATKNAYVLSEMNGSLSGTVDALVRAGEGGKPASRNMTPISAASGSLNGLTVEKKRATETAPQAPPKDNADPFAALDHESQPPRRAFTTPLPESSQSQSQQFSHNNPFLPMAAQNQQPQQLQQPSNLQDSFAGMRLSSTPQPQSSYVNAAPPNMPNNQYSNPFMNANANQQFQQQQQPQMQSAQPQQPPQQNPYAQPMQPQHTSNPYLRSTKSQTFAPTQANPYMQQSAPQNPWLVNQPLVQTPPPQAPMYQTQSHSDFFSAQQAPQQQYGQPTGQDQAQGNYVLANGNNPFYAQNTAQQPLQQPQQQAPQQSQQNFNPYQTHQPQQAQQQQPFSRYDNASILQLYNYPQMAPARPLQSLQEEPNSQSATAPPSTVTSPGRSVTMPISGSMNPFNSVGNGQAAAPPANAAPQNNVYGHTSRDSMAFVSLGSGRQSPDAFAGLSARYGR